MGKTVTPTYYARYRDQSGWHDIMWKGKPTEKQAEEKRKGLNESFTPGGVNEQVSKMMGYIPHISEFQVIRNNYSEEVVVSVKAPMFEVM